jgi:DNA-binding MarR family transcriptional regulator
MNTPIPVRQLQHALGGDIARGKNGPCVRCPGPGHSQSDRSLTVSPADNADGFVVHTFSPKDDPIACKDHVRNKLGLGPFRPRSGKDHLRPERTIDKTYDYLDEAGQLLFQVVRFEQKGFSQRRPDGKGGWIYNLEGVQRVPYRLPELIEALANDRPVFVVEGEKDCDALWSLGIPATCNPHGAGKWRDEYSQHFQGATAYVLPDNDEPGRAHAAQVRISLEKVSAAVRVVHLPGLPVRGDVSDWLRAGGTAEQLYELAQNAPEHSAPARGPKLLNSSEFVRGFRPPDYLIAGILQRKFIYAFTGRTGEGKTTVCLRIAAHVAEGLPLNGAAVSQGRVLYLAGENPDDIRMRWIVLMEQMGLDENNIAVDFVDGRFSISEIPDHILAAAGKHEYVLVIVDTSVAFSQSVDENDNVQQLHHAQALRGLIEALPGGPTILVCCHPPKNAPDDNLQPRGGGAVIAEFDGNLTCKRTETVTEVHHQGKFRGPDFAPAHFILEGVTTARLRDSRGNLVWSVFAKPASEQDQEDISKALEADLAAIMAALRDEPSLSLTDIARRLGWHTKQGLPDKSKVQKRVRKLEKQKWAERDNERLELTDKGRKQLAKIEGRKSKGAAPKGSPDLTLVKS